METTPEWQSTIEEIIHDPGVVVVIGGVDTGKTTFCLELANAGVQAGLVTAVVDSDVGQSEIGPPGTVGMALLSEPVDLLRDLRPKRMFFVGSTSPVNHMLQLTIGVKRMTEEALSRGAQLVVVDTSGLIRGAIGRTLKTKKVQALVPKHVVGIKNGVELLPLLADFNKFDTIKLHSIEASPLVRKKPQDYRSRRRQAMFYEKFHKADTHIIHLDQVVCWNTWFSTGVPMKWQDRKVVEDTLRARVLHAETVGKGIYAVTDGPYYKRGIEVLQEWVKTKDVTVVPASAFKHILVGLWDGSLNCLDVGILHAVDFSQKYLAVVSPLKTASPVRIVEFGSMRVRTDGVEAGRIFPGDI